MNVPPQVMGVMAKVQSSSVGGMLTSMGQRIRPWTTDFGVCSSLCVPLFLRASKYSYLVLLRTTC